MRNGMAPRKPSSMWFPREQPSGSFPTSGTLIPYLWHQGESALGWWFEFGFGVEPLLVQPSELEVIYLHVRNQLGYLPCW